jgi:uncharacterized protein (TIGR02266 family)
MTEWVQPSESERREMARYEEIERVVARQEADVRQHERLSFAAEVTVKSETNFFMGFSENISEGGIFLATLSPPVVGESITITVKMPSDEEVDVTGIVRWHRFNGDMATGCGVQFVDLTPRARQAFESMISQLSRDPLFFEV